uniref:Nuclease associated modular domain-containing protein n=1 Tax=marine sediment metagenome TaxID=412755 RepID=A0A0F9QEL5_9ZZZZ
MKTKLCTGKCGRRLPATKEYFYPDRRWLMGPCKVCHKKRVAITNRLRTHKYDDEDITPKYVEVMKQKIFEENLTRMQTVI